MKHRIFSLIICFLLAFTVGCTSDGTANNISSDLSSVDSETVSQSSNIEPNKDEYVDVDNIIAGMTLKQKVCQMIITSPEDLLNLRGVTTVDDSFASALHEYPVGGLIFFNENIDTPDQVSKLLSDINKFYYKETSLLPFLCVDEEGGRVTRVAADSSFQVTKIPSMSQINDEAAAYNAGNTIGAYLNELGFNVDFAPVADVLTDPNNKVIGDRAFKGDAATVGNMALNYAKGLKSNGVFATFKHFPGHGATLNDTHINYAYNNKSYDEIKNNELLPFKVAADNNVDFVMVAHLSLPTILGCDTPVSLSYDAVTGILKRNLGYKGLIITDSMKMGAIAKNYSCAESSVLAIKAGNDILLMPQSISQAVDAIVSAVQNSEISEEQINASVRKILILKKKITVQP